MFCKKVNRPITFRKPIEDDFLGSGARKEFIPPKHEVLPVAFEQEGDILTMTGSSLRRFKKAQITSAIAHWRVMRTVLPDAIWENW